LLLHFFAGWVNRRQLNVIEYLKEENAVLREQLGGRRLSGGRYATTTARLLEHFNRVLEQDEGEPACCSLRIRRAAALVRASS